MCRIVLPQSIVDDESSEEIFDDDDYDDDDDDDDDDNNNIDNLNQQSHLTTPASNPEDSLIDIVFLKKLISGGIVSAFCGCVIGHLCLVITGKN
ncbi:unnamed protein product [Rotaria sordida]|uniref:Uncharacterized protein n=1 Tax=Rotaria sordida TaxID=392033 RepID=A0A814N861_9BILA|nr:unnamed protein product [Rotaria sordida]